MQSIVIDSTTSRHIIALNLSLVYHFFTFLFVSLVFSQGFGKNPFVGGNVLRSEAREVMKAVRASKSRTRPDKFENPVTRISTKNRGPVGWEASVEPPEVAWDFGSLFWIHGTGIYFFHDFYSTCRQIYHNYMDPMGLKHYHP